MNLTLYNLLSNLFKVDRKYKYADIYYMMTSIVSLEEGNVKKSENLMKIVNLLTTNVPII